jgi:hypothetical protein
LKLTQLDPGLHVGPGHIKTHRIALDNALLDSYIHWTAFDTGWPFLAPIAQVALGECVQLGIIADASHLAKDILTCGFGFIVGGVRAGIGTTPTTHTYILTNEPGPRLGFHLKGVYRTNIQTLGSGALQTRLLPELASIRIVLQNFRIDFNG